MCAVCSVLPAAAPNLIAGLTNKGVDKHRVGIYGMLGPGGFSTVVFANTIKTAIKPQAALPTNMLIGVSRALDVLMLAELGLAANGLWQSRWSGQHVTSIQIAVGLIFKS